MGPVQTNTVRASIVQINTGSGAAQAELDGDGTATRFLLVLTHGAGGGTVVAAGPPEHIAAVEESYTGQFLKRLLAV